MGFHARRAVLVGVQTAAAVWAKVDAVADVLAAVGAIVLGRMCGRVIDLGAMHSRQGTRLYCLLGIEALRAHHQPIAQREFLERDGHQFTALWTSCLQS